MIQPRITPGASVAFDSADGPQRGTVRALATDITNGRKVAAIEVPGTLDGTPWVMPVADLSLVASE